MPFSLHTRGDRNSRNNRGEAKIVRIFRTRLNFLHALPLIKYLCQLRNSNIIQREIVYILNNYYVHLGREKGEYFLKDTVY